MKLRNLLLVLLFIFAVQHFLSPVTALSASNEIVVSQYGGSFLEATKKCYIEPFEKKYNAKITVVISSSSECLAKLRAQRANPQIDVAYMDFSVASVAKADGLIEKLDTKAIPNVLDYYEWAKDKDGYYYALYLVDIGIAYHTKLMKEPPKSWMELWDPKYEGKIAVGDITGTNGLLNLLMAAKLHGGSERNLDPGFEAIKRMRSNILTFYTHGDSVVPLFERGEILMAVWDGDRAWAANKKGVPVAMAKPKEGVTGTMASFSIVKGSKNKKLAEKYVNFLADPDRQGCFCVEQFMGPVSKKVVLGPEIANKIFYGEEQMRKLYIPDFAYVSKHRAKWVERWNKEIH